MNIDSVGFKYTDRSGYHGDMYCCEVVKEVMSHGIKCFIETGSYYGCTLEYMALNYPELRHYSCEPNNKHYNIAMERMKGYDNYEIYQTESVPCLKDLIGKIEMPALFYLDAHGYGFEWPLKDEVKLITENCSGGFIMIDDFRIPGKTQFKFDSYNGQVCGYNYIQDSFQCEHSVYYPTYTENTTILTTMCGWCLIPFGNMKDEVFKIDFLEKVK